jgi:predicted aconitase with swiveling domain
MANIVLKGHKGVGGIAEGEALVCQEPINLMADTGNVWRDMGDVTFTNKVATPSVYGESFAGKVLVFPTGKGGIFSTNIMMDAATVGSLPKAIINVMAHPVWVTMAIVINIPLVDRLNKNPCEVIETGDWVRVDAQRGTVEVTKKERQGRAGSNAKVVAAKKRNREDCER